MKQVRKAVITAGGMGTRVLPASKAVPKEMLPIVDKPAIQYLVEEAAQSGIEDILIITNRGKGAMEDHFDRAPELEEKLLAGKKTVLYEEMRAISRLANIYFARQQETNGTGHAVMCAKAFVGDEPFVVMYGDDVIIGEPPATKEMIGAYEKYGKGVLAIKEVPLELVYKYCSLAVSPLGGNCYNVTDMIEKPKPEEVISRFAILGRCLLTPDIFSILEKTPYNNGELYLTDAMKAMAQTVGMTGVDFSGKRYDMGSKFGMLQAIVEVGLAHPETGGEFRDYLREIVKGL